MSANPVDMNAVVGTHDIVFVTLDTLRYDVAQAEFEQGRLPVFQSLLPPGGWERRHTPGSFTYAAHHAFFAGFLPTPSEGGPDARLFATAFVGSQTTSDTTYVCDQADIVSGLAASGYHTVCIGGVGFFNRQTALSRVLPDLFAESHWSPSMGVGARHSTERQVALACRRLAELPGRVMLFINVSAIHRPNRCHLPGATVDSMHTHAAALRYVDGALAPLWSACRQRGPSFVIVCSDHGSAYGEDGHQGHRVAHECVWTVPYAHFFLEPS
ncbi:STM4013/SEN3800 family hydrolase [Ideonella sp. DXS29W]|uniref:STM4013/SEN3800 family hydrolase n=1 Tax=Ideonella lacteola TaxID=2984193 RepID=A0ABU9C0J8_9BURK